MKTLLVLFVHSFVDLITNSSSELFVCDTKQKIAAFKKTLVKLAELHNEANALRDSSTDYGYGDLNISGLFGQHFSQPRVQPYTFRLDLYPKCAEYRSICDWHHDDVHPVNVLATSKMNEWMRTNPAPKYDWSNTNPASPEKIAYDDHSKKEREMREKIFAEWEALRDATSTEMFRWAFEQNGLDWDSGEITTDKWRRCRHVFKDKKIEQFIEDIHTAVSYGFGFNAGDIMLETASDNTVPYGFFDDIQRVFRCRRIHLG